MVKISIMIDIFRLFICLLLFITVLSNKCVVSTQQKQDHLISNPRWAIVALAKPGKSEIIKRNKLLAESLRPYASKHNITIIMFSEKQFPASALSMWKKTFDGVARVQFIDTSSRGFNNNPERYGYKYMCKFFSLDIYDYLKDNYDYYMRCDTDCYITELKYDILQWAEENRIGYVFGMRKLEAHKPTISTLPIWSEEYIKQCNLIPKSLMKEDFHTCFNFYNNWHIGSVSFFNRPDVRHYLEKVNNSGYILSHRWGDSTIQAYAVRIFMEERDIYQAPAFKYIHGSHGNKIVSTFQNGEETNVPQKLPMWENNNKKKKIESAEI